MPVPIRTVAVALLLLVEGIGHSQGRDEPVAAAPHSPVSRVVVISRLSAQTDIEPIERSILAQLTDLNITVDFHHLATLPPSTEALDVLANTWLTGYGATAVFIIDPGDPQVTIRILSKNQDRIEASSRTVDVARGSPLHEALAVIVHAATTAILERRKKESDTPPLPATPSRQPVPPPALPKAPEPPETKVKRVYLQGGFAMGFHTADVSPGFGMDVGLGVQPARYLYLHLGYIAFSKLTANAYDVSFTLKRNPIHLGVGYFRPLKRVSVGGGVSLVLDIEKEETSSRNPDMELRPETVVLQPSIIVYLHMGIRIVDSLSFFLNVEGEVPLDPTKYSVAALDGEIVLLDPLPVQPLLKIGFRVHFF